MKATLSAIALGVCVLVPWAASGHAFSPRAMAQDSLSPQQQIRASAQAFSETFKRGDAKGLAELWTEDGDYINEGGQRFVGRKAIESEYAKFFAANPSARITLAIDSIRLVSDEVAIEDGQAAISPPPQGPPAYSRYTAVHVKKDGKWLMSSVRDTRIETPSNYARLSDLEFLVGNWRAENHGARLQIKCRWMANKSFLERSFTVTENGRLLTSTREIIGWDPLEQVIKSWTFSSDGGRAVGVWTAHDTGWIIDTAGALPSGELSSAVYVLSHVDDNAMAWKSLRRSRDGVALPETRELVLKRAASDTETKPAAH